MVQIWYVYKWMPIYVCQCHFNMYANVCQLRYVSLASSMTFWAISGSLSKTLRSVFLQGIESLWTRDTKVCLSIPDSTFEDTDRFYKRLDYKQIQKTFTIISVFYNDRRNEYNQKTFWRNIKSILRFSWNKW